MTQPRTCLGLDLTNLISLFEKWRNKIHKNHKFSLFLQNFTTKKKYHSLSSFSENSDFSDFKESDFWGKMYLGDLKWDLNMEYGLRSRLHWYRDVKWDLKAWFLGKAEQSVGFAFLRFVHPPGIFSWILLNSWVLLRSNWRNYGKPFCLQRSVSPFFSFFFGVEKEGFGNDGEDLHIRGDGGCHLCGAQWGRFTLWLDGSSPGKQGSALFLHSFFFLASFSYPFLFCSCELSNHKLLVGDHGNLATGFRLIYLQINRSWKLWKPGDVTPHLKWQT